MTLKLSSRSIVSGFFVRHEARHAMPDAGTIVTFIVLPLIAIASSVLGLKLAGKLGISPVQAQYVALLRGLNDAQQDRIGQLEEEVESLRKKNATLERRERELRASLADLRQELHEVRDLYAKARLAEAE